MPKKAKKRTETENVEKKEEEQSEEVPAEEQDAEEATDEDGADEGPSVDIIKGERTYIRTFSKAVHSSEYKELAKQFAEKEMYATRSYRVVPSKDIDHLEVFYREKEDAEKHLDQQKPDAPIVDKERKFTDREAALRFNIAKKGTILAVFVKGKK